MIDQIAIARAIEYLDPLTHHPTITGEFGKHLCVAVNVMRDYKKRPWYAQLDPETCLTSMLEEIRFTRTSPMCNVLVNDLNEDVRNTLFSCLQSLMVDETPIYYECYHRVETSYIRSVSMSRSIMYITLADETKINVLNIGINAFLSRIEAETFIKL